uniref:Uncharacterized protein n=1 Tax=Podarcis muralis TaxID=64176 RepID=A0A670K6A5_PODMU
QTSSSQLLLLLLPWRERKVKAQEGSGFWDSLLLFWLRGQPLKPPQGSGVTSPHCPAEALAANTKLRLPVLALGLAAQSAFAP